MEHFGDVPVDNLLSEGPQVDLTTYEKKQFSNSSVG